MSVRRPGSRTSTHQCQIRIVSGSRAHHGYSWARRFLVGLLQATKLVLLPVSKENFISSPQSDSYGQWDVR